MTRRTSPISRRGYGHRAFGCTGGTKTSRPYSQNGSGGGEPDDAEGRQGDRDGLRMAVPRDVVGPEFAATDATAAELGRIRVEHHIPPAGTRKAQPVAVPWHG